MQHLHRLAASAGIVARYLDQTGTEWRDTSDESYVALLRAMGIEASSERAADAALRALRAEARRELVAPVRVVEHTDDTATRHVAVRLASSPRGAARWRVELETEAGEIARAEGAWPGGRSVELPLPWPDEPTLGYHLVRVAITINGLERVGEQSLIIAPGRCVLPHEILGDTKAFGLVANLYTLRSEQNWGAGDFTDLTAFVRWSGEIGAAFVGLNPLHALLDRDGSISPYSPVSRLFRNPLYVDVAAVPELRAAPRVAERIDHPELQAELAILREGASVEYEKVMALKAPVLEELHAIFLEREVPAATPRSRAYDEFVRANDPELTNFATWMAIAERAAGPGRQAGRGGAEPNQAATTDLPAELRHPDSEGVRQFRAEHAPRIAYHKWVQFELDRQLGAAADSARSAGLAIGLYQDLAIGTSPHSADVWAQPELFVRGASIGAAPDPYSATGQNWGLPPLDPRALRRDRYRYFVRLVRSGFRHAGALRIDHVMGLFRMFWIPEGHTGSEGAYVRYPAADLLSILALESVRHRALVVGEDLGTVPTEVPPALMKKGILSSKVLYFERDKRGRFKPAAAYSELALATANTHDMPTLAGFWEGRDIELRARVGLIPSTAAATRTRAEREEAKDALIQRLQTEGVLASDAVPNDQADLRGAVHEFLCRTPAVLVGLALDDLAGERDAVNLPGVGPDRYPSWTRKMTMTIDEMRSSDAVRRALRVDRRSAIGHRREDAVLARAPSGSGGGEPTVGSETRGYTDTARSSVAEKHQ